MLADLASLFEDVDVFLAELRIGVGGVVLVDKLRQAQRACHARGAAADNHNVGRHLRALDTLDRFAEDEAHKNLAVRQAGYFAETQQPLISSDQS